MKIIELTSRNLAVALSIATKYRWGYIFKRHDLVKFDMEEANFICEHVMPLDPPAFTEDDVTRGILNDSLLNAAYKRGLQDQRARIEAALRLA